MALHLESVSYEVNSRPLVKDVSFHIHYGEIVAILGANGAGKSTLMSLISGQKRPATGFITLDGIRLENYSGHDLAQKRALLQQQNHTSLDFTVEEVVMMGRYGQFTSKPTTADRLVTAETMEICGVTHLAERSLLHLSGGEQQRVHLARVLAQLWDKDKGLILMDEPVSGMDIQYQQQTMAVAAAMARKGFMVIAVLHDINLAAQYASRILMLKAGRKLWDGAPSEVLTTKRIFNTFGVAVQTITDPATLKMYVIPQEVTIEPAAFSAVQTVF